MRLSADMQRELMSDVLESSSAQNWEWTFLDAPNEASGPVPPITRQRWPQGRYCEWWNATAQPDGTVEYVGLERTLDFMREVLTDRVLYEEQKAMLEHWAAPGRTVLEHAEGHVPPSLGASAEVLAALGDALESGTRETR
jgi:hypothetical protein